MTLPETARIPWQAITVVVGLLSTVFMVSYEVGSVQSSMTTELKRISAEIDARLSAIETLTEFRVSALVEDVRQLRQQTDRLIEATKDSYTAAQAREDRRPLEADLDELREDLRELRGRLRALEAAKRSALEAPPGDG